MASSAALPAFPSRNYASGLGGLPDRGARGSTFGHTAATRQRESQQQERERLERESQDHMKQLSEEQKDEINEAV